MGSVSSVERYDAARGAWEAVAPMAVPRMGCGMAATAGALYVMGGRSSGQVLDSVEQYDVEAAGWRPLAPMREARSSFGLAVTPW
mmetsp:Transcript_60705/g.160638  ORF Transcript_60705/g.160638 Transcript_60705/m.160638 type:complete len:85 (+) Transcript_60705:1-255(+)